MIGVLIYGKPNCPFCDMAKQLCEREGLTYTYKSLGEDFTREEMIEKFPDARTFPQIIIDGEYCGGYTELNEWNRLQ
tara:strand:+ start:2648 stop:2878 length:231 start_codon:yes stop_codon:yes gene_type:complete